MAGFDPIHPGSDVEWPPTDPLSVAKEAQVQTFSIADGSITNDKLASGIDPRKIQGVGMKVALSAQQGISDNTAEPIEYDLVVFSNGFDAIDNFQIPVPYDGIYLITVGVDWNGTASEVDDERAFITVNGNTIQENASPNISNGRQRYTMATATRLTAGDLVGLEIRHISGATRTVGQTDPSANNLTVIYLFTI